MSFLSSSSHLCVCVCVCVCVCMCLLKWNCSTKEKEYYWWTCTVITAFFASLIACHSYLCIATIIILSLMQGYVYHLFATLCSCGHDFFSAVDFPLMTIRWQHLLLKCNWTKRGIMHHYNLIIIPRTLVYLRFKILWWALSGETWLPSEPPRMQGGL